MHFPLIRRSFPMAVAALKRKPEPAPKMFHATVLITRAEEWCVEAETAEEARELQGQGHRGHLWHRLHAEVQENDQ
jgi:hypothetical protein